MWKRRLALQRTQLLCCRCLCPRCPYSAHQRTRCLRSRWVQPLHAMKAQSPDPVPRTATSTCSAVRSFVPSLFSFWVFGKEKKTKQVSGRLLSKMCNKLFTRTCLFKYHNDRIHMNNTRDTSSNFLQFNQMTFLPMCSFLCFDRLTACVRFHFFSFL